MNDTLNALYDSEINVEISSFWDAGWIVKIGDAMNGFAAEMTFDDLDENTSRWLTKTACELYPQSEFAKAH